MRRIVYLQGGGPTAVINESFLGVLSAARKEKSSLYVSRNGLMGLIENRLERIDLEKDFSFLTRFPGAYFGSARISLKKDPESLLAIVKTLKDNKVDALLLNGGNDTMDSAMRISKTVEGELPSCHVVGIPKTIDNDLVGTDRCPGFLSAAKYVAYNVSAILADDRSYKKGRINVIEVMGRDNGSLAASASLAFLDGKPDFIFIPEIPSCLVLKGIGQLRKHPAWRSLFPPFFSRRKRRLQNKGDRTLNPPKGSLLPQIGI